MKLRGKVVYAHCDQGGALSESAGRVAIVYGRRGKRYDANILNLEAHDSNDEVFDESHVEIVQGAGAGKKAGSDSKVAASSVKNAKVTRPPTRAQGNEIIAYTDGGAEPNPGPCGLGAIVISADSRATLSEFLGEGTNNIAELTAILRALEYIEDTARPVRIFTDSSYAIGLLTKNWKPKKNVTLTNTLKARAACFDDLTLVHVRGHQGIELNELADTLATEALRTRATTGWRVTNGDDLNF